MNSNSENHGLSLISNQEENIYSVGMSTGGIAEIRMARALPNRHILATNIELEGANFAQHQIEQASLSDRIKVKIEDIAKPLPYADESFDFVYARLVLHYLPKPDLQNALQELHRILKSTGRIFVIVRSAACLEAQEGYYNPKNGMTTYTSKNGDTYNRYFHSEDSICDFLKSVGFYIKHIKTYDEQLCIDFQRTKPSNNIDNLIEVYASKSLEKNL
ncbi:class I SAM-dependent methyltransferase [Parachlamydia sp. AcF125]|uniref:class I SAM-dependent methyltransferase n=1 Tax=Parachlamydia sp. AcF125 TaxID=2795736 RepID=UPI001BC980C6|nr:class I SAM-dependent methyltransferase [Parachlamydia sp. AcF125]MBS4168990.1 27-O-demethylrifamycin SV methyltransferase [Parachlamydia sp. AcF125]